MTWRTTSPTTATTFLHQQQLPVLQQQLLSCSSNHLPAAAATSPAPVTTNPDIRLPVLHQQSSPAPATKSCTNYQFSWILQTASAVQFLIMIPHNKIWSFKATILFCHSCLVVVNHLYFRSLWDWYIYWPQNIMNYFLCWNQLEILKYQKKYF